MRYLSFDLEATGLKEKDFIIEFGMIPFCTNETKIEEKLSFHCFIQCPSFEELKPTLDPWVIEHNRDLIEKAHKKGLTINQFKTKLEKYLTSPEIKEYFGSEKVTLFGKSVSAIDLPFLNRDLGWKWMRTYFEHRQLDLSSVAYHLVDLGFFPSECTSGSYLSEHLGLGKIAHTALEDARNTALMYLEILKRYSIEKHQNGLD